MKITSNRTALVLGIGLALASLMSACSVYDDAPVSTGGAPAVTGAPTATDAPPATAAPPEPAAPMTPEAPSGSESATVTPAGADPAGQPDGVGPTNDAITDSVDPAAGPGPETDDLVDEPVVDVDPVQPGLGRICPSVVHGDTSSGIWVRGEVYGLDGGWIWVEGPTINGGDPVRLPVSGGLFDGPLPITEHGNHLIERFELGSEQLDAPIDLVPVLEQGPGVDFPVGPAEGPLFDTECFEIEPSGAPVQTPATVQAFLDDFVGAHRRNDVERLQSTLHPSIRLAYGDDVCTDYIQRTAGSIIAAQLLEASPLQALEMETPTGPLTFPEAIAFTVEFTLADGSTVVNDAHLPLHDGEVFWLTTCGVEMP